jgi:hypothetical protein
MHHLRMFFYKALCLSVLLSWSSMSLSAELTDLYQAEVDANQSQNQWQQAAVAAVLVKLTGGEDILKNAAIATAIRSSSDYIKQFQMVQRDGRNLLQVTLDQQKITSLLQQLQIPIWGSRRPDVLLWLTEKTLDAPQLVVLAEHPLRNALVAQAKTFGLSYLFPRYDEQELTLINAAALWSGDWSGLTQVSTSYQATQVFNLLVEQNVDLTGQLQYRLTSQTWLDGVMQTQEFVGAEISALLLQFSQQLAASQAAQYAVNVQAGAVNDRVLQFKLDGIESLTDLVSVQKLFGAMLTVRQQQLVAFEPGQATLQLTLASTEQDFYRALALEKQLQPQFDTEKLMAQGGTMSDLTNLNDQSSTQQPSANEAMNHQEAAPAISDAEQALEAALSSERDETSELPAVAASNVLQVAPPANVVIPLGHAHFRFVRP